jgi:hypothetical protein
MPWRLQPFLSSMPTAELPMARVVAVAIRAELPTIAAVESAVAKQSTEGQPTTLAVDYYEFRHKKGLLPDRTSGLLHHLLLLLLLLLVIELLLLVGCHNLL